MPNRYNVIQGNDMRSVINQTNQNFAMLDKEVESKVFYDRASGETLTIGDTGSGTSGMLMENTNGKVLSIGRYKQSRYGLIGVDSTGTNRILIGTAPDDGRIGIWVSKTGQDVITLLGG